MATSVSTSYVVPSATTSATPTSTAVPGTSHGSNNPLLFFVALGFGVLFTNLWIIIGVKYCFRYQNARRRGLTLGNGDALAMGNVHNGRRRREKKLMTMEEVQSKFPQMTYKAWRVQRERQGLSTEGGVEVIGQEEAQNAREALNVHSPSRAASIRSCRSTRSRAASMHSMDRITTKTSGVYEITKDGTIISEATQHHEDISPAIVSASAVSTGGKSSSTATEKEVSSTLPSNRLSLSSRHVLGDLDEQIDTAEISEQPSQGAEGQAEVDETDIQHLPEDIGAGDTCAICIEQLEEEDEVRGLSCGHAFHCSCVDVWLTTRRAICPLCKRDYWVRKATQDAAGPGTLGDNETYPQATMPAMPGVFSRSFWRTGLFSRGDAEAHAHAERDLEDARTAPEVNAAITQMQMNRP